MSRFKKILALMLAVVLTVCLSPGYVKDVVTVQAEDGNDGNENEGVRIKSFEIMSGAGIRMNDGEGTEGNAPQYFKAVTEGEEAPYFEACDAEEFNVAYEPDSRVLTLRNLTYVFNEYEEGNSEKFSCLFQLHAQDYNSDPIVPGQPVTIQLEGTNTITAQTGELLRSFCDLTIQGEGTLALKTESETYQDNEGTQQAVPFRFFGEQLTVQAARVTTEAAQMQDQEEIPGMIAESENLKIKITDGGEINGRIETPENAYGSGYDLVDPASNPPKPQAKEGWTRVEGGNAYYFYGESLRPNNHFRKPLEGDWTIYGEYASDGTPKESNVCYQYLYVNSAGMLLTDDVEERTQILVYEDDVEDRLTERDVAAVEDGKEHTFSSLYSLWLSNGNVTVNGDITLDLACFAGVYYDNELAEEDMPTGTDQNGNVTKYRPYLDNGKPGSKTKPKYATDDCAVTVEGNVGLLSLNQSYKGDATVNGDVNMVAYYKDQEGAFWITKGDEEAYGYEQPEEHFYGAKPDAGKVVLAGVFTDAGLREIPSEELNDYCIYDNTLYMRTSREVTVDGEVQEMKGTSAVVEKDSLRVEVTNDQTAGIDAITYPCIRKVSEDTAENLKAQLTNAASKLSAMEISLVRQSEATAAAEVEPTKEVNLHIDGLSGFTKPALFHVKADGTIEKLFTYEGTENFSGAFAAETGSFSTYFVTEDQLLRQDVIPEDPEPYSYPGSQTESTASTTTQTQTDRADTPLAEGETITATDKNALFTVTVQGKAGTSGEAAQSGEVVYEKPLDENAESVTIPATVTIDGISYRVTAIAEEAFKGNTQLTSVKISKGITVIGAGAFEGANALENVTVPNTVTDLGKNVFKNCTNLKKAVIGASVTAIPNSAFEGCTSLKRVTLKSTGMTKIGGRAFKNCTALTGITLPEKITVIGTQAFANCKGLKKVIISGTSVKKIRTKAFTGVPSACKVIVPKNKVKAYTKLLTAAGYKGKVRT